jgi:general secretion pathway protein I
MVALAVLAVALTYIAQSQQQSVRMTNRAKLVSVATLLAREKLVDLEDKLFEDGFSDFEQTEEGDFREEGFERFRYELVVDKVELPSSIKPDDLAHAASDEAEKSPGGGAALGGMMGVGAKQMSMYFDLFRNILEQSIRRVQLKVIWDEGSLEQSISLVSYFTDPRKIDAALSGAGQAADGTSGSGTSGSGTTSGTGGGSTSTGTTTGGGTTGKGGTTR